MSVSDCARDRGISEIVHYTSERGVMGTIMKKALLSRQGVEEDDEVDFIFEGIWERKDPDWVNHISLSVSRVNLDLFHRSRENFPDYWWAIFSFGPEILDDSDVWFTTTNNVYEPCRRGQGVEGFQSIFEEPIPWGHHGSKKWRSAGMPDAWPTDRAAEVLYPASIGLEHLQKIYVPGKQHRRLVRAWSEIYGAGDLPIEIGLDSVS
jgi:hypothetical protein